jgi:hypothetical protein
VWARSSLAELERLVKLAEVGGTNIGEYLVAHGEELGPRLGVEAEDLRSLVHLPDDVLGPQLGRHFERRAEHRAAVHAEAMQRLAFAAAERLAVTAVWRNDAAMLDIRVLLGELLVDTSRSHVLLDATSWSSRIQVNLPRSRLVDVAKILGRRPDVGAWVDEEGLHFRWGQGRGGLNLLSRPLPANQTEVVLHVNIPPPYVERPRPPLAARHPSSWFSELLHEMALA